MLLLLLFAHVLFTSLWPLGELFATAFRPGEDGTPLGLMAQVLAARSTGRALANTLATSAGSVAISAALGVSLALAMGLARMRGQGVLTFLILMPVIIPSQTMALAWIELSGAGSPILGPLGLAPPQGRPNPLYSAEGIALVMGVEHMPLVFLATRAALRAVPGDLVEAARIAGVPRWRRLCSIVLPIAFPAVLASALLAFTAAVGNFGVPALLGIPGRITVLTTLIYQRLNGFGPSVAGQVAVLALLLTALAVAALALRTLLLRRLQVPLTAGRPIEPGPAPPWVAAAVWLVVALIALAPLAALAMTALLPAIGVPFSLATAGFEQFSQVLGNAGVRRAFANSLFLALAAAAGCMLVALPYAYLYVHRRNLLLRLLDPLIEAPWVVPGTVVALGMILAFLNPLPVLELSLYGTMAILLIAYLARFLPLVLRPVAASAQMGDPALDEAARIAGAGLGRRLRAVFAPSVLPSAIAGGILVLMTALNELTLSALLWSSGHETIGVMVFALQYEGNSTAAAAVSVLSTLLLLAICLFTALCARWLPKGALPWQH